MASNTVNDPSTVFSSVKLGDDKGRLVMKPDVLLFQGNDSEAEWEWEDIESFTTSEKIGSPKLRFVLCTADAVVLTFSNPSELKKAHQDVKRHINTGGAAMASKASSVIHTTGPNGMSSYTVPAPPELKKQVSPVAESNTAQARGGTGQGGANESLCAHCLRILKAAFFATLEKHVLFNICLMDPTDTAYTRMERILNFVGFLGTESIVSATFASLNMFNVAVCACLEGNDRYEETACHTQGDTTFSLPFGESEQPFLRAEWLDHLDTTEATQLGIIDGTHIFCPSDVLMGMCSANKVCCDAFVASRLEAIKDFDPNHDYCADWMYYWFAESLLGFVAAGFFLAPLVEWLLRKESTSLNPVAYFIIFCQVLMGIVMPVSFNQESKQLGLGGRAWISVIVSVLVSLFFHSIYLGIAWEIFQMKCTGGGSPATTTTRSQGTGPQLGQSPPGLTERSVTTTTERDASYVIGSPVMNA